MTEDEIAGVGDIYCKVKWMKLGSLMGCKCPVGQHVVKLTLDCSCIEDSQHTVILSCTSCKFALARCLPAQCNLTSTSWSRGPFWMCTTCV